MRKPKWSVERVKKSFHKVSREEMKRTLAEVWDILINGNSQQAKSLSPSLIPVYQRTEIASQPKRGKMT